MHIFDELCSRFPRPQASVRHHFWGTRSMDTIGITILELCTHAMHFAADPQGPSHQKGTISGARDQWIPSVVPFWNYAHLRCILQSMPKAPGISRNRFWGSRSMDTIGSFILELSTCAMHFAAESQGPRHQQRFWRGQITPYKMRVAPVHEAELDPRQYGKGPLSGHATSHRTIRQ